MSSLQRAGRRKLDDLREFLKARLPGYMIPASFLFLERMPVNAHGKVDRTALRAIDRQETTAGDASVAPRHATEKALADIWIDLLKVENIGVIDNFFDLGGSFTPGRPGIGPGRERLRGVIADQGRFRSADYRRVGEAR